jgi:hypothetical protein
MGLHLVRRPRHSKLAALLEIDDQVDKARIRPRLDDALGLLERDDVGRSFLDDAEAFALQLGQDRRLARAGVPVRMNRWIRSGRAETLRSPPRATHPRRLAGLVLISHHQAAALAPTPYKTRPGDRISALEGIDSPRPVTEVSASANQAVPDHGGLDDAPGDGEKGADARRPRGDEGSDGGHVLCSGLEAHVSLSPCVVRCYFR